MKKDLILLAATVVLAALAACGGDDNSPTPTASPITNAPSATGPTPTRTPVNVSITEEITVFAASSLTAAFTQIGEDFEAAYPGISVNLNFGGSQDLRVQLEQGAKAEVFAAADSAQMDAASGSGLLTGLRPTFARNKLIIIVPAGNEANLTRPQDLANSGVKVVLAGENVPVGKYARQFLDAASTDPDFGADYKEKVLANVVSEASNVKEVVSTVQLDEADAGIVYVTDVTPENSGDLAVVEIPDSVNQIASYPISLTYLGAARETAQLFIDYVTGEQGQATLAAFGFAPGDR